jgi:hypothetical protein
MAVEFDFEDEDETEELGKNLLGGNTQEAGLTKEIDEYAVLMAWKATQKEDPRDARLRELASKMQVVAEELFGHGNTGVLHGVNNKLEFGMPATSRKIIDIPGLYEKMGKDAFLKLAALPLGKLDAHFTEHELEPFIEKNVGKSRSIKILPNDD